MILETDFSVLTSKFGSPASCNGLEGVSLAIVCVHVGLSLCLFVSFCVFVDQFHSLFVVWQACCLTFVSVYHLLCQSVCLFVSWFVCLFICQFVCVSGLSVCLFEGLRSCCCFG